MHVISRNEIRYILYSKIEVIPQMMWDLHSCSISQYFKIVNIVGVRLYGSFLFTLLTFIYVVDILGTLVVLVHKNLT